MVLLLQPPKLGHGAQADSEAARQRRGSGRPAARVTPERRAWAWKARIRTAAERSSCGRDATASGTWPTHLPGGTSLLGSRGSLHTPRAAQSLQGSDGGVGDTDRAHLQGWRATRPRPAVSQLTWHASLGAPRTPAFKTVRAAVKSCGRWEPGREALVFLRKKTL